MVGVMDSRSVLKAARLFGLCTLLGPSSGVFADSHAPHHDRRALQTGSNIVFIDAVVGTAFTTDEQSGLQLQVQNVYHWRVGGFGRLGFICCGAETRGVGSTGRCSAVITYCCTS